MLFACFAWTQAIKTGCLCLPSADTFTEWSDVEVQRFTRPAKFRICHKGIFEKHCPVSTKMGKDVNRNRNEICSNQEIDCGIFWNYSLLMLFFIEGEGVNPCRGGEGMVWDDIKWQWGPQIAENFCHIANPWERGHTNLNLEKTQSTKSLLQRDEKGYLIGGVWVKVIIKRESAFLMFLKRYGKYLIHCMSFQQNYRNS